MKLIRLFLVLAGLATGSMALRAADATALRSGDYIAVCGDSITEQKIYSAFLEEYFLVCQPAPKLEASQFGWGGETSWGFLERMQNDVLPFAPKIATLCYGMNDGDYRVPDAERAEKYRAALTGIVQTFKKAGLREIVVGSPGPVDSTSFKGAWFRPSISPAEYNQTLAGLAATAQKVATTEVVRFANLHAEGTRVMQAMKEKYGDKYFLFGDDGIHPKEAGHLVMAYALLKSLGCDGNIGTIEVDLSAGKAKATEGHEIVSASSETVAVKSSRYPFCFYGNPSKPDATAGVIEFLPFNEQLNRFRLVVRHAPAGATRLKVAWGGHTKEFTVEQLEKGINLAAEFIDNPFSEPFRKVHEAVLRQQRYETPMMKELLHSVPDWKQNGVEGSYDEFVKQLVAMDVGLRQAASKSVVPVTHEIRISR
jgi:lysophospholipase L1-like esterase